MNKKADHDLTGWFVQSLRLKSTLHLVKRIDRCGLLSPVVASDGIAGNSRPFHLAFAGVESPRRLGEVFFLASLPNSSGTERESPSDRAVSGSLSGALRIE
jgi:hypothetical protein